jgi:O-antigen/teichoic acid export membrane protein
MIAEIKYFLKHTAIYSISNVLTKAAGFFLIPLYTNSTYLSPADFGLFGIIDISLTIAAEILTLGQANSILMFGNSAEYREKKNSSFFTVTIFVSLCALIIFSILLIFTPIIASLFSQPLFYAKLLRWSGMIVFFRIVNNVLLSKLRADEQSGLYTTANSVKIVLSLFLTIYFLVELKLGVLGILYAYFIAEIAGFLIVFPWTIFTLLKPARVKAYANVEKIKFDKSLMWTALKFGFPLALATIGSMALNLSDRYVLKFFTDFRTVAIYDLGYRIAGVLNMFIILPFSLTLLPVAFKVYGTKGDKRYYTKMLTYLTFILVWFGLAQSLLSEEFIRIFTSNPLFKLSYPVVPIVTFAYIFSGTRLVTSLGLYFSKKTRYVALAVILSSIINIVLNFIFIPKYGMLAAAYNTLFAFIFFHYFVQFMANKDYYIPFENWKIIKAILVGCLLFLIVYFIKFDNFWIKFAAKIVAICIYPFLLYIFNFYEKQEIKSLKSLFKKWSKPSKLMENLSNLSSTIGISEEAGVDEDFQDSNN